MNNKSAQHDVAHSIGITVSLCFLIAMLEGWDIQALGLTAGPLMKEFGMARDHFGWLGALSGIGVVLGAMVGGRIADHTGRKPVLIWSVISFAVFTLAMTVVPNASLLFAARTLAGVGFGAALPNMMAIAAEISSEQRRALVAGIMFSGLPAGGGTASLVARLLPPDSSWRVIYILGGVIPLILVPALVYLVRETLTPHAHHEQTRKVEIMRALFSEGRAMPTLLLWLTFLPTLLILYLMLNWLPNLVGGKNLGAAAGFESALAFNYCSILGAVGLSYIVDHVGLRWPLLLAYAALVAVLIGMGATQTHAGIVTYSGLSGFLLLGANYAMYGIAAAYYPMRMRGTGSGASVAVGRIGSIVGPWLAGQLLTSGMSSAQVIAYMAPLAAIAGIAVFVLSFYRRATG